MKNLHRLLALAPVAMLLTACPGPAPTPGNNAALPADNIAENTMANAAANAGNTANAADNAANEAGEVRTNDDRRRSADAAATGPKN